MGSCGQFHVKLDIVYAQSFRATSSSLATSKQTNVNSNSRLPPLDIRGD